MRRSSSRSSGLGKRKASVSGDVDRSAGSPFAVKWIEVEMDESTQVGVVSMLMRQYNEEARAARREDRHVRFEDIGERMKAELDKQSGGDYWNIVFGRNLGFHVNHHPNRYAYVQLLDFNPDNIRKFPHGKPIVCALIFRCIVYGDESKRKGKTG